ncbi:MAG: stage II sporulation protein M [Beutenbergiaceae bacterium]
MDVDAFVAVRSERWRRMEQLTSTRVRDLDGAGADELIAFYQASTTDYSRVRTRVPDPGVVSRLSRLLSRGRSLLSGAHEPAWSDVTRFFGISLPAAFYRVRWWTFAMMMAFIVIGVLSGWWALANPEVMALFGTPESRRQYAERAFEAYYSEFPAQDFAGMVWTNNSWISAQAIAMGITGIGPIYVLSVNAISVGQAGAVMIDHDMTEVFFGLILPHGMLELTAIFVACGAGLKLFWAGVSPGPRTRGRALAREGRSLITLVLGLALVLAVSAIIEGFVTPSGLPGAVKIAIGALALALYWVYALTLGRIAARDGETGDMRAEHQEDTFATVD